MLFLSRKQEEGEEKDWEKWLDSRIIRVFFQTKWFSLVKPQKAFHVLAKKLGSNTKTTFATSFKMS